MKIEKIKNFNQVILAIVGVMGIILLLFLIAMSASDLRRSWSFGANRNSTISNSLISEERVETLNQENKRLQVVSYESPKLIDSLNGVYIIPVSVSTLDKPQEVVSAAEDEGSLDLVDINDPSRKNGYYKVNSFEGLFANLVVYQASENKSVLLFNERIMLNDLRSYTFKDDILLVFYTAEKDTNKDGVVNFLDDTNLCIYSLKSGKMRRIAEPTNSIKDYQFIENSKDLLIEFSLSQYRDVKFKSFKPRKIMKYEFETGKLTEIVPVQIQEQIQKLLEGKSVK